jgi:hypothetical protein
MGFRLEIGLFGRRLKKKRNQLSPEKIKKLESLPKWSWNAKKSNWDKNFSLLVEFVERKGHSRVPHSFKTENHPMLFSSIRLLDIDEILKKRI